MNSTPTSKAIEPHDALISRAEHMKARRVDPVFVAKQAPAAREAASNWLKAQHAKPKFHKKSIEAARPPVREEFDR